MKTSQIEKEAQRRLDPDAISCFGVSYGGIDPLVRDKVCLKCGKQVIVVEDMIEAKVAAIKTARANHIRRQDEAKKIIEGNVR